MSLPQTYNLLANYPNLNYVETGIWRGDSLQMAIDAGFEHIYGIDSASGCIEHCRNRFGDQVSLWHLYSTDALPLLAIPDGTTFLFDAHWQFLEGTEPGPHPFPLLDEIKAISSRRHPSDVVIIDDWHIFYYDRVGYGKEDVLSALVTAGFSKFEYVANPVIDGILIAKR